MTDKYTTKELITFLDDAIDYLGLYSPDKDGMIHTGFTVNQIAKIKQIKEKLRLICWAEDMAEAQKLKQLVTRERILEILLEDIDYQKNSFSQIADIICAKLKSKGVEVEEKP